MNKKIIIFIMMIIMMISLVFAGDNDKIGTTAASELLIPIGARSIALGSATIASVSGAEAIYWNPAGLVQSEKSEFVFSNMSYIADIDVNYISGVFNAGDIGAFGFHIKTLDFGDMTETRTEMPKGTGRSFSPTFVTTGLTYGRKLTDRISAGITAKIVYESIMQTSASAIAFDMGVQYSFVSGIRMGVVLKNIGSQMTFEGRNLEQQQRVDGSDPSAANGYFRAVALSSDIPTTFSFGLSYDYSITEENNVQVNSAFTQFNNSSDQLYGGMEYSFNHMFFVRGGYAADLQNSDDAIFGGSFGAGFIYSVGQFDITIDYAFRQVTEYFDSNNIFTIKVGL